MINTILEKRPNVDTIGTLHKKLTKKATDEVRLVINIGFAACQNTRDIRWLREGGGGCVGSKVSRQVSNSTKTSSALMPRTMNNEAQ